MSFRDRVNAMNWRYTRKDKEDPNHVRLRTHNQMDGGELSVHGNEYDSFLQVCAECICDNEKLFIVEQRSHPVYRVFFDIDFCTYNDSALEAHEFYKKLSKFVVATLYELFNDSVDEFRIVCSTAAPKQIQKNQREATKYGVHIVAPDLVVNKLMMLRIREAVVQKLQNNFEKFGPTSWQDDIDPVVYESSGLRMNYSRKGSRCKCSLKDRDDCDKCNRTGKIDEGRPYTPLFSMNQIFLLVPFDPFDSSTTCYDGIYQVLKTTSIRSTLQEPNVKFNDAPPSWFEDPLVAPDGLITQPARQKRHRDLNEGISSVENKLENQKDLSSSDLYALNNWFQLMCHKKLLPKEYKKVEISKAFSYTQNSVRSYVIARVSSQYCMNIGREHSTNTVYLLYNMTTQKACMKCYCRCLTKEGRRSTSKGLVQMCKDFSSSHINTDGLKLSITCGERVIKPRILAMF